MVDGNAPKVFKKYRKELNDIINGTLFNYVKDAFRIQLNKYTTDQIVSNRDMVEAQRALNEVAVKKAEAEKMLVQARAEREANELKSASLTPAILKKMWIEKWDGKLPIYGNVPQMMITK